MTSHPTPSRNHTATESAALPTFMDHIRELQGRLFIIASVFVGLSAAAYPFFDKIAAVILAPLEKDQELVYLTPGGAFSFIIKVCLYIGIIGVLPLIIYHLYRFVMPAVKVVSLRRVMGYTVASFILALCGIAFAYFVSLPAALYFLTGFDLYHINPMITIDSYFSFVMTYVLAGAVLFQIPLIMKIIDSATPLKPGKLMGMQRHIIVGSFIVAAIISPTPDAMNQTILASPMVGMYQVGVLAVWSGSRTRKKRRTPQERAIPTPRALPTLETPTLQDLTIRTPARRPVAASLPKAQAAASRQIIVASSAPRSSRSIDGFQRRPQQRQPALSVSERVIASQVPKRPIVARPAVRVGRSIDGIVTIRS